MFDVTAFLMAFAALMLALLAGWLIASITKYLILATHTFERFLVGAIWVGIAGAFTFILIDDTYDASVLTSAAMTAYVVRFVWIVAVQSHQRDLDQQRVNIRA